MGLFINTLPVRLRLGEQRCESGGAADARAAGGAAAPRARVAGAGAALQRRGGADAAVQRAAELPPQRAAARLRSGRGRLGRASGIRGEERTNYPMIAVGRRPRRGLRADRPGGSRRSTRSGCAAVCSTALEQLVEALERAPDARSASLDVLPAAERRLLLEEWNQTAGGVSARERCIHELFEEQAARTPDAVAVVYEDEPLTYARARTRARTSWRTTCAALGVGPDDAGGALRGARRWRWWWRCWAILKAGGAYVPLDPELSGRAAGVHAGRRRRAGAADAGAAAGAALPGARRRRSCCLDATAAGGRRAAAGTRPRAASRPSTWPTSSTPRARPGTPKGREVPHRGDRPASSATRGYARFGAERRGPAVRLDLASTARRWSCGGRC